MTLRIRPATAADAPAIGTLAAEFQAYLRSVGSTATFTWGAAEYLRDGFGPAPAFEGAVAEIGGHPVGFALFDRGYDTDRGQRYLYLIDLFVTASARGSGVGQALMAWIGEVGRRRGAELIAWSVAIENHAAVRFYERLGARFVEDQRLMWCPIGDAETSSRTS